VVASLCERFSDDVFFGNFHQGWTEFVLTGLGIFAYETVPVSLQSLAFRTPRATSIRLNRFTVVASGWMPISALDEVVAGVPPRIADCEWLEERRQKLLFQIARAYERSDERSAAIDGFCRPCTHRGARLRTIRLHERAHEWGRARELCLKRTAEPRE